MGALRFNKIYFLLFLLLLAIEICIALYINDTFIRPFLGDVLVVMLLYSGISAFATANKITIALIVLLFAFAVEIAQAMQLIRVLGLEDHKVARIILGSTFDWKDMLAYTIGIAIVLGIENLLRRP